MKRVQVERLQATTNLHKHLQDKANMVPQKSNSEHIIDIVLP